MSLHYETKQAILEEAGLSQIVIAEALVGVVNGVNKVFTTTWKPLTDANDDDIVDITDVTVYVNGSPVSVTSLVVTSGTITLTTAPANLTIVTCDYRYSNVTDAYMTKIRDEAEGWINDSMDAIDIIPYAPVPPTVRKLTRWYAAAQLLTRDYGFNQSTTLTSKDGAAKMTMAEKALDKYIAIGGASGLSDVSAAELDVYAEPNLFLVYDSTLGYVASEDDRFIRDEGVMEDPTWSS